PALPHWQRLVRRVPAGDGVRHRRSDGQHLLRSLVSDRGCGGELRRWPHLPARDQGSGHHPYVIGRQGGLRTSPCVQLKPRATGAGLFLRSRAGASAKGHKRTFPNGNASHTLTDERAVAPINFIAAERLLIDTEADI